MQAKKALSVTERWDQTSNDLRVKACIVKYNRLDLFVETNELAETVNELHWMVNGFFYISDLAVTRFQRFLSSPDIILHERHHLKLKLIILIFLVDDHVAG